LKTRSQNHLLLLHSGWDSGWLCFQARNTSCFISTTFQASLGPRLWHQLKLGMEGAKPLLFQPWPGSGEVWGVPEAPETGRSQLVAILSHLCVEEPPAMGEGRQAGQLRALSSIRHGGQSTRLSFFLLSQVSLSWQKVKAKCDSTDIFSSVSLCGSLCRMEAPGVFTIQHYPTTSLISPQLTHSTPLSLPFLQFTSTCLPQGLCTHFPSTCYPHGSVHYSISTLSNIICQ
jgi:hypothetical protein